MPRSSASYEPRPGEDRPLRDALTEVAGQWPTYGSRRLTKQLQRAGHAVNTKRVRRLMHELGIVGKARSRSHPESGCSVYKIGPRNNGNHGTNRTEVVSLLNTSCFYLLILTLMHQHILR